MPINWFNVLIFFRSRLDRLKKTRSLNEPSNEKGPETEQTKLSEVSPIIPSPGDSSSPVAGALAVGEVKPSENTSTKALPASSPSEPAIMPLATVTSIPESQVQSPTEGASTPPAEPRQVERKKVFVINGRNELMCAKVLQKLKGWSLKPTLSFDQYNEGKSLAQKLAEVGEFQFAVVILSADELAFRKDGIPKDARLKATANVVFEMGYVMGKLQRNQVFILYQEKPNFDLPTKFYDAVYTPMDESGRWERDLHERLKANGYLILDK